MMETAKANKQSAIAEQGEAARARGWMRSDAQWVAIVFSSYPVPSLFSPVLLRKLENGCHNSDRTLLEPPSPDRNRRHRYLARPDDASFRLSLSPASAKSPLRSHPLDLLPSCHSHFPPRSAGFFATQRISLLSRRLPCSVLLPSPPRGPPATPIPAPPTPAHLLSPFPTFGTLLSPSREPPATNQGMMIRSADGIQIGGKAGHTFKFICLCINNQSSKSLQMLKKTNSLFAADCRRLSHLFFCRALQMWSADCRRFDSEKTNSTLGEAAWQ
ncbi:hypothetical protein LXL04_019217 [Taraxacum kok-saghyz]